jgi:multidrug efflux system outer membrane protein
VRRANEAALADLTGDAAVRDGVQSAVAANVAHAYFEALALRRQINLLERLQETRTDNLRLQKLRLDGGLISPYDYEQSRSETAAVAARLPELRAALQNAVTALSVLSGRSPAEIFRDWQSTHSTSFAALPEAPRVPLDLPSQLLERRPDIRAAEQRLIAANARIGEAKAAYFPSLSLTAFAGGVTTLLSTIADSASESWNATAGVDIPLSDLRRTGANTEAARARRNAAAADYAGVIQIAFKETLDSLSRVTATGEVMQAQDERVEALSNAYRVASARYRAGRIGYLEQLDVERQLREVEQQQVSAKLLLLQATVDLYRALGGGWQPT